MPEWALLQARLLRERPDDFPGYPKHEASAHYWIRMHRKGLLRWLRRQRRGITIRRA